MPGDRPTASKTKIASYIAATVTDDQGNVISHDGSWHDARGNVIEDPDVIAQLDAKYPIGGYQKGDAVMIRMADSPRWTKATVLFYHGAGTWVVDVHGTNIGVPHTHIKAREE